MRRQLLQTQSQLEELSLAREASASSLDEMKVQLPPVHFLYLCACMMASIISGKLCIRYQLSNYAEDCRNC